MAVMAESAATSIAETVATSTGKVTKKTERLPSLFKDGAGFGRRLTEKMLLWILHKNDSDPDAYHHKLFIDNVDKLISPRGNEKVKMNMFWLSKQPETWPRFLTKHGTKGPTNEHALRLPRKK